MRRTASDRLLADPASDPDDQAMHIKVLSALLGMLALASGCTTSTTVSVVDIDAGYKPVSGATVAYYPLPHRKSDPWATTPAETKTTGADGEIEFQHNSGRFVATVPGKGSASMSTTFSPQRVEIGVGGSAK